MQPLIGGDLLGGHLDLAVGAPRLYETDHDRPQKPQSGTPPDAPDEGETQQYRKEREEEARRIIPRNMDRFVGSPDVAILRGTAPLLHGPERVRAVHLRQMGEVP